MHRAVWPVPGVALFSSTGNLLADVITPLYAALGTVVVPLALVGVLLGLLLSSVGYHHGVAVLRNSIVAGLVALICDVGARAVETFITTQVSAGNDFGATQSIILLVYNTLDGVVVPLGLIGVLTGLLLQSSGHPRGTFIMRHSMIASILSFVALTAGPHVFTWLQTQ
jgi:hypothetical protein